MCGQQSLNFTENTRNVTSLLYRQRSPPHYTVGSRQGVDMRWLLLNTTPIPAGRLGHFHFPPHSPLAAWPGLARVICAECGLKLGHFHFLITFYPACSSSLL